MCTIELKIIDLVSELTTKYGGYGFNYEQLNKYYRITRGSNYGKSAYAFVAKMDFSTKGLGIVKSGDILKPATWRAPAKHARGSVLDKSTWDCCEEFGLRYLK